MSVKIERSDAVELFEHLGITTASKWNAKRMAVKLAKVDEMVDDDTTLPSKAGETLTEVLKAISADEAIEVISTTMTEPEPELEPEKKTEPATETEGDQESEDPEFVELKAQYEAGEINSKQFAAARKDLLKGKPKTDKKKPVEKKEPAEKPVKASTEKKGPIGVRENDNTRPYLAGVVLAKHGFEKGITDEMVSELNDLYKNVNDRESRAALTYGWHVARGYANTAK